MAQHLHIGAATADAVQPRRSGWEGVATAESVTDVRLRAPHKPEASIAGHRKRLLNAVLTTDFLVSCCPLRTSARQARLGIGRAVDPAFSRKGWALTTGKADLLPRPMWRRVQLCRAQPCHRDQKPGACAGVQGAARSGRYATFAGGADVPSPGPALRRGVAATGVDGAAGRRGPRTAGHAPSSPSSCSGLSPSRRAHRVRVRVRVRA